MSAPAATRSQIEATIRTLRRNIAQDIDWFGEDSRQVGRKRELLAESQQRLAELDRKPTTTQKEIA